MIRVLFVDDEPHILSGLQRMLRPLRHEWTMIFAEGVPAALEALDRGTFDVVVTDMRMPGMSGAQLLAEIGRRSPQVAGIVLSGQTDPEQARQLADTPHDFLAKPCDAEVLKKAIGRACRSDEKG